MWDIKNKKVYILYFHGTYFPQIIILHVYLDCVAILKSLCIDFRQIHEILEVLKCKKKTVFFQQNTGKKDGNRRTANEF